MAEYVRDDFLRTVASGWGNADVGGAYTESLTACTSSVQAGRSWSTIAITGVNAGVAYERLAAATAAAEVTLATAIRVAIALTSEHEFRLLARVSGAVGDPVGLGARVRIGTNGAMVLELVKVTAGNVVTVLNTTNYPAATYVLNASWRLELELAGTPLCKVRARLYPTATPPGGLEGWLTGSDAAAPGAGVYGYRISRVAPGVSATSWPEIGDLFVSDRVVPAFTATAGAPPGVIVFDSSSSTGDFTARAWSFGDGTSGSGTAPSHTYALPGTYRVRLTVTTRWSATYYAEQWVTVAAAPPDVLPIVLLDGQDVCESVYSLTWSSGVRHWSDAINGDTCSIGLRGLYPAQQGMTVSIHAPTSPTKPLWAGVVDQVTETREPIAARDSVLVIASDTASYLGRAHVRKDLDFVPARLPERLDDIRPWTAVAFRPKWPGVAAARYPMLDQLLASLGQLRDRTYLDLVRDALAGSVAFGFVGRDGAIVYAPWEPPAGVAYSPINLDSGLDCAARVEVDRRSTDGLVNRWTVGDGGTGQFERVRAANIERYGEHAFTVAAGVLLDQTVWPPVTAARIDAMEEPSPAPIAEIPITDLAQRAIYAEPLDTAKWENSPYAVLGVRHEYSIGSGWRVTLTLDRDPWGTEGGAPPV